MGDETTASDEFDQCGPPTGMVALLPATVLAQGDLHDCSQSMQKAKAQPQTSTSLALVIFFQTETKAHTPAFSGGNSEKIMRQMPPDRIWGSHEQPVFQRQMAREDWHEHAH